MPGPERAIWLLLLGGAVAAVLLIALARNTDEDPADTRSRAEGAAETTSRTTRSDDAERPRTADRPASDGGVKSCRAIRIPADPPDPITCRTSSATLTIAGEGSALLLGGTHIRVLSATLDGRVVTTRLRVRNETGAEQGVQAGGMELYLNIASLRADPRGVGDVRIADGSGETVTLEYTLTAARLVKLRNGGLRAELGAKPWDEEVHEGRVVGVVRVRVRSASA